jgi:predicted membrane channel-forming protein YqfA (hemolysin III family)
MTDMLGILGVAWVVLAWFTHVITCLSTAKWGFLIAGAIFFPVGCVHGTGIWFGWF